MPDQEFTFQNAYCEISNLHRGGAPAAQVMKGPERSNAVLRNTKNALDGGGHGSNDVRVKHRGHDVVRRKFRWFHHVGDGPAGCDFDFLGDALRTNVERSEERRVGKEGRSRWSPCP